MKPETLIDVICASHLSTYVASEFQSTGGIMFVGPPGTLKTSMLGVLEEYPNASIQSDLNTPMLSKLKDQIVNKVLRTVVFLDIQKLWERHSSVSANLEGHIRALVDEGFTGASFQDSRIHATKARAVILGAVTDAFLAEKFNAWESSGFLRRFLWCRYRLDDPHLLMDAVVAKEKICIGGTIIPIPANRVISDHTTEKERIELRSMIRYQVAGSTAVVPFQMFCKIAAVLKWHYTRSGHPERHMEVLRDFAPSLGKEGCELELTDAINRAKPKAPAKPKKKGTRKK